MPRTRSAASYKSVTGHALPQENPTRQAAPPQRRAVERRAVPQGEGGGGGGRGQLLPSHAAADEEAPESKVRNRHRSADGGEEGQGRRTRHGGG